MKRSFIHHAKYDDIRAPLGAARTSRPAVLTDRSFGRFHFHSYLGKWPLRGMILHLHLHTSLQVLLGPCFFVLARTPEHPAQCQKGAMDRCNCVCARKIGLSLHCGPDRRTGGSVSKEWKKNSVNCYNTSQSLSLSAYA